MSTQHADIAVIGGGLVGAAIAYGLADGKRSVVMLDEGDVALRAARGNFGLVWVQGKGMGSPAYAAWTRTSARRWPELARQLREDTGIDVALSQPGGVRLLLSERELADRRAFVSRYFAQGGIESYPLEILDRSALQRLLPDIGPDVVGASYCPLDGHVNPLKLLRALHVGLVARGGRHLPAHKVTAIARGDEGFVLTGARGRFVAPRIVLAAGLGNVALAQQVGLRAPVRAQRGQIIALERVHPFLPLPIDTLRQTDEGTVLVGDSQEETASTTTTTGVLAAMAARAVRAFPRLADARVVRAWAALRVLSPDGFPIYEQSREFPGAFVVSCHSGVTLAAAHALELAQEIGAGRSSDASDTFSSKRFDVPAAA